MPRMTYIQAHKLLAEIESSTEPNDVRLAKIQNICKWASSQKITKASCKLLTDCMRTYDRINGRNYGHIILDI